MTEAQVGEAGWTAHSTAGEAAALLKASVQGLDKCPGSCPAPGPLIAVASLTGGHRDQGREPARGQSGERSESTENIPGPPDFSPTQTHRQQVGDQPARQQKYSQERLCT